MQKFFWTTGCLSLVMATSLSPVWSHAQTPKTQAATRTPITLSLLAINDFHGNILPPSASVLVPDASNATGTRVSAGGAAYLATLIKNLKQHNPKQTLVVGDGDLIGATPLASGFFHDEPTIDILNQIGLDLSTVGNHEFDKGRAELLRMQKGGCYPPSADAKSGKVGVDTCMTKGKFGGARFQYLAANVVDQASGQTLFPAYAIRTLGGVKVGFIGVTLQDTPSVVTPAGVAGLQFRNEVETVNALVPLLKEKGVTVFVVLLHQGGTTKARMALDKSCPGVAGESLDLVDRMDPAIDVVVNGHTHQEYVCFRPDGKLMTQAGFYGRMVTKIDLTVDRTTRKVIAKDANNKVVVNDLGVKDASGKPIPLPAGYSALQPDPATNKLVQRYGALAAAMTEVVVGRLSAPLDRRANSAGESTLGNFIADAFLASTSGAAYGGKPSQIAFMNRGGLRSDLSTSLSVSHGHLFNVMPFNDVVVAMDLTGQQLLRLLEQQWESPQPAGGRIMSVSNGFTYSWDASAPERAPSGGGQRIVPGSMKLNGEPIDMERVYRVTVNNFMSVGGDNYSILPKGLSRQDGEIDLITVKRYFERQGVIKPPELGRIVRVN